MAKASEEQLLSPSDAAADVVLDHKEIVSTLLLGAGFFFTFTAWHSTQNLQSSLSMPSGVSGTTALCIVYALLPVGFSLAHAVVRTLGKKITIMISMAMYMTFIAANMYPRWWSIYPGAVLVGLGCGPMFVSCNVYITEYAVSYAKKRSEDEASRVGLFQGIFQACFMLTQAVGNTFYSLLFNSTKTFTRCRSSTASLDCRAPLCRIHRLCGTRHPAYIYWCR